MGSDLQRAQRRALRRQRWLGYIVGLPVLWSATVAWLKYFRRYRIRGLDKVRSRARALLRSAPGPVVVCPNHLTWIDSLLVQWAISSPGQLLRSFRLFAWNVPEHSNFDSNLWLRLYCYLGKCVPIHRGGDRGQQKTVMEKLSYLLYRGELVMVFPEGGRTTSGRVEADRITYGVGRIVNGVENCSVLCVYLRGDKQAQRSVLPAKRQSFSVDMELIEPTRAALGLRAQRDTALQIGRELVRLEQRYFDCR